MVHKKLFHSKQKYIFDINILIKFKKIKKPGMVAHAFNPQEAEKSGFI